MPSERIIGVLGTKGEIGAAALNEGGEILYGSPRLNPERFSWSSSVPDVATVDEDNLVTGVSEGTATITATSKGVTGTIVVTVRDRARFAWSVPFPAGIDAGPAVAADGTIYVGTDDFAADQSIWYALSPQGGILWTTVLPLTWRSSPAIGEDGTLYLGSRSTGAGNYAGRLIAVGPGGTVRWVLEGIDGVQSPPTLGPDGTIYIAGGRHVYAVDPQGRVEWAFETTDNVFFLSSPAVASDGTIYVGGEDGLLYALNPSGSLRWTFRTGDRIRSSPAIGLDGAIYLGSLDGRLYAVNPDGTMRWSVELDRPGRGVKSSPSIGPDGRIYVFADGLVAVAPGGSIRWRYPLGSSSGATPILGADGTIYLASITSLGEGICGVIFALDSQGRLLWDYPTKEDGGAPVIGIDGTIIAPAGRELVAIAENGSTNGGYAGAPWPQMRGNRANTGRAGE